MTIPTVYDDIRCPVNPDHGRRLTYAWGLYCPHEEHDRFLDEPNGRGKNRWRWSELHPSDDPTPAPRRRRSA